MKLYAKKTVVLFKINVAGGLSRVTKDTFHSLPQALENQTEPGIYIPFYCDELVEVTETQEKQLNQDDDDFEPADAAAFLRKADVMTYVDALIKDSITFDQIPPELKGGVKKELKKMMQESLAFSTASPEQQAAFLNTFNKATDGHQSTETNHNQGEGNS